MPSVEPASTLDLIPITKQSASQIPNTVGDPLPRIQCPAGYTATLYAEGLSSPDGLALNPDGELYVAEEAAGRVSHIEADGSITPIISGLHQPEGIDFDNAGNLYVVEDVPDPPDTSRGRLLKISPDGITTTLVTDLDAPEGVVWAADGTLYITQSNVQFTSRPSSFQTWVTAFSPLGGERQILNNARYWSYAGITVGPDGLLYVTNEASGVNTHDSIFRVDPFTGSRTLFASNLVAPEGLRFAADGQFPLYVAEEDTGSGAGVLSRVEANGSHMPFCTGFYSIEDVIQDEDGRLYVSEDGSGSVILIQTAPPQRSPAHAIILFIGDGMGEAHRTAGRWSAVGQSGALAMDRMPFVGWAHTASANKAITDSAAAATAIATGVKTRNGMIGQAPDGTRLTTILERAQAKGMAVGLVTNVQMAHATPAGFAAHVPNRDMMTEIARQMLATRVDVLFGGGENQFVATNARGCFGSGTRTDRRNLIAEATAAGYTHICHADELATLVPTSTTHVLGLFADEAMGRPFSPSLAAMTQKAIDILSQDPDGFFLMVEGGQIDWASDSNDAPNAISDTVGLDEAVAVAHAYASTAPGTLVIVTADHETGGMSVNLEKGKQGPFYMPDGTRFYVNWSTIEHTAADVPTTARGPWSDLLAGSYQNTHIHDVMCMALRDCLPEMSITQAAMPGQGSTVTPGDLITYTIALTNNGVGDATGVVVTDTLDPNVNFVDVIPGTGVSGPNPLVFDVGTLPKNGGTVSYTVHVSVTNVTRRMSITNRAILTSDQTQPQESNSVSHLVQPLPAAVGDPLPRIQCPAGYTATLYADGLSSPDGLALGPAGMLYVAEETAGRISRVESDGSITPIISGLHQPEGITFDGTGNLYVVEDVPEPPDTSKGRLLKISPDGITTTLATDLDAPEGVVWAVDGTLYVTESNVQFTSNPADFRTRVTAISAQNEVTRILTDSLFWSYAGITIGPDGLLYVTNEVSGIGPDRAFKHNSVFRVDPTTRHRDLFASNLVSPEGLRFAADGQFPLYVAQEDTDSGPDVAGMVSRVEANGSHMPFCTGFYDIEDVIQGQDGRLYVSEDGSDSVILIQAAPPQRSPAHAIILFIGDGIGEAHRTAGRWSAVGQSGALAMDRMPFVGWAGTRAANDAITDSAAAATALATGVKTTNGKIAMDPNDNPLTTILERAQARGMAVGLVTNIQMAHATPAGFAAHVPNRDMMTEIASQMLEARVDVLLGGGENQFVAETATECFGSGVRTDGRDLVVEATAAGYTHVCQADDLATVVPTSTTRLLGLFADEAISRPFSPSLGDMTRKAIEILSQDPDGFFLMVEGGQIDWASQDNDAANVISDTIGLDEAIAVAQTYALTNPYTLVIVTADHETGGMSADLTSSGWPNCPLPPDDPNPPCEESPFLMPGGTPFYINWETTGPTVADVPTTSLGPWSDLLAGSYANTYIHDVMCTALGNCLPEVTITQVAVPDTGSTVAPGDLITYTIALTNHGPADATGVVMTDTLDLNVNFVDVMPGAGVSGPNPIVFDVGILPRQGGAISYSVHVRAANVITDTVITNLVAIASDQTQPQESNSVSHLIQPLPGPGPRHVYLPLVLKDSGEPSYRP
jgi:alkaline phosphatase